MSNKNNHSFNTGDIIFNRWGFDQTNIDFYQVVRTTKTQVILKPLNQEFVSKGSQSMEALTTPNLNDFSKDKEIRKKVQNYRGEDIVNFEYGTSNLYTGTPQRASFYA